MARRCRIKRPSVHAAAAAGREPALSGCPLAGAKLFVLLARASGRVIYYLPQIALLRTPAENLAGRKPGGARAVRKPESQEAGIPELRKQAVRLGRWARGPGLSFAEERKKLWNGWPSALLPWEHGRPSDPGSPRGGPSVLQSPMLCTVPALGHIPPVCHLSHLRTPSCSQTC